MTNAATLMRTAQALVADGKGLLAMDESNPTCNSRFARLRIPQTVEARRAYRELIVTTPGLGEYISGAILYDETLRQRGRDGLSFVDALARACIVPGIKVDVGAVLMAGFPGEKTTEGLDGLRARLSEYYALGARFAKWRAVIAIGAGIPSVGCILANTHALARYAAICQEAGLVPVVEPEVLMDGDHTLGRCLEVTEEVLHSLFSQLYEQRVDLQGVILKPNMVLPGKDCPSPRGDVKAEPNEGAAAAIAAARVAAAVAAAAITAATAAVAEVATVAAVADATVTCLMRTVPAAVPGIAFLSGGQTPELASAHLNAMNLKYKGALPWALTFSYSRAIQQPALEIWRGEEANRVAAQQALRHRARCNAAARRGEYVAAMEGEVG